MKKIVIFGDDARLKLKTGIDTVSNAVKLTIGPSGRNVVIGRPYQTPLITNDGATIAKEIVMDDEIEELGAQMVKQASKQSNDKAGDGTTTTTVILQSIVDNVYKKMSSKTLLDTSVDVMVLKREIDTACKLILSEIDKRKTKIKTKKDLQNIARISVENEELGDKIADMIWELGEDAVVNVEVSHGTEIDFEIFGGAKIIGGWASEYLCTDGKTAIHENPNILVTNHKIDDARQIQPIIKALGESGKKNLVIICDSYDKSILIPIVQTHTMTPFKILLVKSPNFNQIGYLKDIEELIGGKVINKEYGDQLEQTTIENLGTCSKLIASKDDTILMGTKKPSKSYVDKVKEEIKAVDSQFDKERLQKRLAFINSAVGVIKVGAESETEKEYLKLKVDDAVYATKVALEDGYVKGGGLILKEIAESMEENILTEAIKSPYNQINKNAGRTLEITEDIIDPAKVTKNAITNACSVAKIFITTEVAIADKNEKKKDQTLDDDE